MDEKIAYLALSSNFSFQRLFEIKNKQRKSWLEIFYAFEKDFKIKKDWEKLYSQMGGMGIKLVFAQDLPERIRVASPLALFIAGDLPSSFLYLSIVGTRRASALGRKIAKNFAFDLASSGIVIVSGAAIGIDTAAHLGAIDAKGKTIAILGEGIDRFIKAKKNFADKLIEFGAIVSEYPPETPGLPENFPLRNRLIAAFADGVILIEVPERSGALITARYALDYGKEIFVVPESIYNKKYFGGMRLIQQGANLVLSVEDIFQHFNLNLPSKISKSLLSDKERIVYDLINQEPRTLAELIEILKMPANELLSILTALEMKKLIFNRQGQFYGQ